MVGAHLLRPMSLPGSAMAPASVLLFDFEDGIRDGSQHGTNAVPFELSAASAARTIDQLDWMLSPSNEEQRTLRNIARICIDQGGDAEALASMLQRVGLSASLRKVMGNKLHSLRHCFVVVAAADVSSAGTLGTYIVDPAFRDAFAVAHPTPRYAAIVASLPQEVVATPVTLSRVVSLLAREMAKSFADSGADLPPWRTTSAMLARWQLPAASGAGLSLPAFGRGAVQAPQPVLPTPESKAEAAAASVAP